MITYKYRQANQDDPTGCGIAEVPVLRLRQAFWLVAVSGCKPVLLTIY